MEILLLACGCYWILMSLMIKTKEWFSSLLVKIIPFFTGVIVCLVSMNLMGWVSIWK